MFSTIFYPDIDPIFFSIGPIQIRWYAIAYLTGIIGGAFWATKLIKYSPIKLRKDCFHNAITWIAIGIILGGRIGYILFYQPEYYFSNPIEMFKVWRGGMSFHGGLIGVIISLLLFSRYHKIKLSILFDIIATVTPIGLGFGRLANFVNRELIGIPTDGTWGMVFSNIDSIPRHPSQLYEMFLEGIVLFIILNILVEKFRLLNKPYFVSGVFSITYGIMRFFVEYVREPERTLDLGFTHISYGQMYSVPMVIIGIFLLAYSQYAKPITENK